MNGNQVCFYLVIPTSSVEITVVIAFLVINARILFIVIRKYVYHFSNTLKQSNILDRKMQTTKSRIYHWSQIYLKQFFSCQCLIKVLADNPHGFRRQWRQEVRREWIVHHGQSWVHWLQEFHERVEVCGVFDGRAQVESLVQNFLTSRCCGVISENESLMSKGNFRYC